MKKFFTFFAVLFLAVAANATKTLYLQPNADWKTNDAKFAVWDITHSQWGEFMTLAENETAIYTTTIADDVAKVIFVRLNPALEEPKWNTDTEKNNSWNQTQDMTLEDDKDMCVITGWNAGEWSKYEYVEPAKFYITGSENLVGEEKAWHKDAITVTADSYTFENLAVGTYQLKVITADDQWIGFNQLTARQKTLFQIQPKDNNICFTLAEAGNVTVNYVKDGAFTVDGKFALPTVQLIGINGKWSAETDAIDLTPAEDSLTASVKLKLTEGQELKMLVAGAWLGKEANPKYELKRDVTTVDSLTYAGENLKLNVDKANADYTFTYSYATGKLTVTFPDFVLENGFYLVGKFDGTDAWDVEDLTAAKKFTWNKHVGDDNEEWMITLALKEGDKFKAAYVYHDAITSYTPDGEGNEYVVDADHAGAAKTIYFQQKSNDEWGGHFYVAPNESTALDNTAVEGKATKSIVNGMLLIIRDGKTYNVLGTQVK